MLRRVAAHIVAPAPTSSSSSPPPATFRSYDFAAGEQAPPSGELFARTIPPEAWVGMSHTDRVRSLEVEGFCVVPRSLDAALVAQLRAALASCADVDGAPPGVVLDLGQAAGAESITVPAPDALAAAAAKDKGGGFDGDASDPARVAAR